MDKIWKKNKKYICLIILFSIVSSILITAIPFMFSYLIENFSNLKRENVVVLLCLFVIVIMVYIIIKYILRITMDLFQSKVKYLIRKEAFEKIIVSDFSLFYKYDIEYYSSILVTELEDFYESYFESIILMISSIIQIVVISIIILLANWIMGIVIISTSIIALLIPKITGKKLDARRSDMLNKNEEYLNKIMDLLSGYNLINEKVKSKVYKEYDKYNYSKSKSLFNFNKYYSFIDMISDSSTYLIQIVMFIFGFVLINKNLISIAGFSFVYLLSSYFISPLSEISYYYVAINSSNSVKKRLLELLNVTKTKGAIENNNTIKNIEFKNVVFERDDFSLNISELIFEFGKKYAIIGHNGSGKSTLIKILLGGCALKSGEVLYNGENIINAHIEDQIAVIPQSPYLFEDTIYNNITLFGSIDDKDLSKHINEIRFGLDLNYMCKNNGENLSGGEKQKISILRALNKNKKFLILDEAYSAIDEESEIEIKNYINRIDDLTLVEVTHDISQDNLNQYDYVIEIKDGRVNQFQLK